MSKSSRKKRTTQKYAFSHDAPANESLPGINDRQLTGERLSRKTRNAELLVAVAISLVTFLVYLPSLRNELLSWDDYEYVTDNAIIRSLDLRLIKSAFLEFHAANWHPLTLVSHALDYAVWGLNPLGHHLTNNILHALNTFLVVVLVIKLLNEYRQKEITKVSNIFVAERGALITAGVTGLLFGIHPAHVESVAWVAERKDLLCSLFFLLSIIAYTGHLSSAAALDKFGSNLFSKKYLIALGFFILALLSKPMAVSLPAVLLILDWYPFRKIQSTKTFAIAFLQKIPFIALSVITSILTILAQKNANTTILTAVLPFSTRVLVAAKALIVYLWKMILPLNLMPLYPYPLNVAPLSFEYFSPLVTIVGIQAICIMVMKRHNLWLSVWSYYIVTLLPVLGLVQVGGQSMADRYTYLPSIGLFLLAGLAITWILSNVWKLRKRRDLFSNLLCAILFFMFVAMAYLTTEQIGIWRNDIALWTYMIEEAPNTRAYFYRGKAYYARGQLDKALADYDSAISLEPYRPDIYCYRGLLFAKMGQYVKAIQEYDQAITWNQYGARSDLGRGFYFLYRGGARLELGQTQLAISDFGKACELGSPLGCRNLKSITSSVADRAR